MWYGWDLRTGGQDGRSGTGGQDGGQDGPPGQDGRAGRSGQDGRSGRAVRTRRSGRRPVQGRAGQDGRSGTGAAGRAVRTGGQDGRSRTGRSGRAVRTAVRTGGSGRAAEGPHADRAVNRAQNVRGRSTCLRVKRCPGATQAGLAAGPAKQQLEATARAAAAAGPAVASAPREVPRRRPRQSGLRVSHALGRNRASGIRSKFLLCILVLLEVPQGACGAFLCSWMRPKVLVCSCVLGGAPRYLRVLVLLDAPEGTCVFLRSWMCPKVLVCSCALECAPRYLCVLVLLEVPQSTCVLLEVPHGTCVLLCSWRCSKVLVVWSCALGGAPKYLCASGGAPWYLYALVLLEMLQGACGVFLCSWRCPKVLVCSCALGGAPRRLRCVRRRKQALQGARGVCAQVLYAEQLREYPRRRATTLRCELFGQAGFYALVVRAGRPTSRAVIHSAAEAAFLKAAWSEKFVFNVHARSIFPCDPLGGGVPVLFQYPQCILEQGDRVRLFARLSADVASLAPPTSLHYTAEQRVTRGQHALHFHCDLFSERFVEYCFVYVSQAITGAVSDVRVDCVPTLPVREGEAGGWGAWSAWTACSSTCGGGVRSRYRLCDSPPPRYGAAFCAGAAVQSSGCGRGTGAWDCPLDAPPRPAPGAPPLLAERPEVLAEVGPGCRCGCTVHLGPAKPRRLLAASARACPGRSFWLVQAEKGHAVRLALHRLRLPCAAQWLKVRDGNSLAAQMVARLTAASASASAAAPGAAAPTPPPLRSSGQELLLEFFSEEATAADCDGEFIAHALQI
ncbi:uncharacterized protein GBIM_18711, partial [Gryllus bimaculatus]